jgi:hypothetical protein
VATDSPDTDREQHLRNDSDSLLEAVREIRDLEQSKRGQQMSSPEFHRTAEEITDKTRRVFEIASDEEHTGNGVDSQPKTTEDVKPR